jgi:hypothetical protein
MKLAELASKPKLIKVELTSKEIVKEYGEALEFWTWDRQPMKQFVKLANIEGSNFDTIMDSVRDLVLDEDGNQIITEEVTLPTTVLMQVIGKVVETLGK